MAHFQNQYSAPEVSQVQTDEFGNPIRRTDEYGNLNIPKHETDRGILGIGSQPAHHGLHRTGSSSSSSSSEDEGTGRKKGLKQKLKGKLPGGHKDHHHQPQAASTTTTPGQGPLYHQQEKKGLMDKIKDKLPGHHHNP